MKTRSESRSKKDVKQESIKVHKKPNIIPKNVITTMTTKNKNQFNNSKETYTLEMQILTNFSKSKPTLLTKDMLVISEQDKREGEKVSLDTYPLFTYQVEYPVTKIKKYS